MSRSEQFIELAKTGISCKDATEKMGVKTQTIHSFVYAINRKNKNSVTRTKDGLYLYKGDTKFTNEAPQQKFKSTVQPSFAVELNSIPNPEHREEAWQMVYKSMFYAKVAQAHIDTAKTVEKARNGNA